MRNQLVALAMAGFGAGLGHAQTVAIDLGNNPDRIAWVGKPASAPPTGASDGEKPFELDLASAAKTDYVYALDRETGALARLRVANAKDAWKPREADFNRQGMVAVQVKIGDLPLPAGAVTMQVGAERRDDFLDPANEGKLSFWDLPRGECRVTVKYKDGGKDMAPVTGIFTPTQAGPPFVLVVPGTGATPLAGPSSAAPTAPPVPEPSPFGRIFSYLLGLGIAGAAIYFGLQYAKKNEDLVQSKLEKLGVQIPTPGVPDDLPDPAPMVPTPPAPLQKIILDDAAPDPIAPLGTSIPTGRPRLISESGDVLELEDGMMVVGREVGTGLSLPSESTVSRRHAEVNLDTGRVTVKDLGSTNGTFVNGARLDADRLLLPGDLVQFGSVRFRFEA